MRWLRENYGWKAKRIEYIWLATVLALIAIAVAWWLNGGQADYMSQLVREGGS